MRSWVSIALAAAIALGPALATAAVPPPPSIAGVWDGTIGDLPVRVCFNEPESSDPYGVYFYRSRLHTIPLIKDEKGPWLFSEGWPSDAKAPRWVLLQSSRDTIGGTWKQGSKTLPVKLTRVAQVDDPCGSLEFHQPRLEGVRILQGRAVRDGVTYTTLTLDDRGHFDGNIDVESFQLRGSNAAVQHINAVLKKPFDDNYEDGWLSCVRMANPWGGDYHEIIEPRMISQRWLVVNHHWDGFCGGAHPDSSNTAMTFDLRTGRQVDVLDWFNDKAIKRTRYEGDAEVFKTIQPGFRRVVIGRWKGDGDCADTIDAEEWWNIELSRTGFVFTPILAHVVQACGEDFRVPFARLMPYLTPEGRKNIAELQAEVAKER